MNKFITALFSAILILFSACSKSDDNQPNDFLSSLEKVAESTDESQTLKVEVYSEEKLHVGYNKLYFRIIDQTSKKVIQKAKLSIQPMMEMQMENSTMSHSSPVENPTTNQAVDGLFNAAAVFTMASDDHGTWALNLEIQLEGETETHQIAAPITVTATAFDRIKTVQLKDGSSYMISYVLPSKPKVGVNDFEVAIYKRVSGMSFPAANDFTIKMTPTMPSMNHGSPNNINPIFTTNGHYKGKVNFTMTGDWRIDLELTKAGETVQTFFDLLF